MENTPEATARAQAYVHVLAAVLSRLVESNAAGNVDSGPITKFHALHPPGISIGDYLDRYAIGTTWSSSCGRLGMAPV